MIGDLSISLLSKREQKHSRLWLVCPGILTQPISHNNPNNDKSWPFRQWLVITLPSGGKCFLWCNAVFNLQLRRIVELLGQPADHLLNGGLKTKDYFNWTESNSWELKVPRWTFSDLYRTFIRTLRTHQENMFTAPNICQLIIQIDLDEH